MSQLVTVYSQLYMTVCSTMVSGQQILTVTTATITDTIRAMTDMAETLAELQLSVSHVKMQAR